MIAAGIKNPLPLVPVPKPKPKEILYFSPSEVESILTKVPKHMIGAIVLALYVGLRPNLLTKLKVACVNMKNRKIHIEAHLAKDRRPHLIETEYRRPDGTVRPGIPLVVWEWLEKYPYVQCSWPQIQRKLRKILGYWVQDGCRHTAATFCASIYGKAAASELLTHEGKQITIDYYIGVTTCEQAEAFYALKPGNIASIKCLADNPVDWPPNEELERRLNAKPATEVAADLGCSGSAVAKHCRKNGIPKPSRGYWAKVRSGKIDGVKAA